MKKLLAAILLFVYFLVSTGFVVSLHYCMDRLASAQIGGGHEEKCAYCGMQKDGKCCRDDVKIVKLQTIHLVAKTISPDFILPFAIVIPTEFLVSPFYNFRHINRGVEQGPPLSEQETYLQNCVFRI